MFHQKFTFVRGIPLTLMETPNTKHQTPKTEEIRRSGPAREVEKRNQNVLAQHLKIDFF